MFEDLRSRLATAEREEAALERLLQKEMDRFLFHDGFFPLTHAAASRGFTETILLPRARFRMATPIRIFHSEQPHLVCSRY
jgi:hypothetical protein